SGRAARSSPASGWAGAASRWRRNRATCRWPSSAGSSSPVARWSSSMARRTKLTAEVHRLIVQYVRGTSAVSFVRLAKLTAEVHRLIVQYVRGGAYDHVAAQAAGIDPSTFRRWMVLGDQGRPPYGAFHRD